MIFMKSKHKKPVKPGKYKAFKDFEKDELHSGSLKRNKNYKTEKYTKKRSREDFYELDDIE